MFGEFDVPRVELKIHRQRIEAVLVVNYPDQFHPSKKRDVVQCLIDTGASRTTIPQRVWSTAFTYADALRLNFIEKTAHSLGAEVRVLEGRLSLQILGTNLKTGGILNLGECDVWLALDESAGTPMPIALFGVGGGCMAAGGLCINWQTSTAHIVEVK